MDPNTRSKILSIVIALFILSGGISVCVLIELVASGPLMNDDGIKGMIMVFTAVSFLLSGFISLLAAIQGDMWVKKIQLSMEALFLIATTTSFLALKEGVYIPVDGDCVQHANDTGCSCTYVSAKVNCDVVYSHRSQAYSLVFLYVVTWIFCLVDLIRVAAAACSVDRRQESEIPGLQENDQRFYNISYPTAEEIQVHVRRFSFFKKKQKIEDS